MDHTLWLLRVLYSRLIEHPATKQNEPLATPHPNGRRTLIAGMGTLVSHLGQELRQSASSDVLQKTSIDRSDGVRFMLQLVLLDHLAPRGRGHLQAQFRV